MAEDPRQGAPGDPPDARIRAVLFTVRFETDQSGPQGKRTEHFTSLPGLLDWLQARGFPADDAVAEWLAGQPIGKQRPRGAPDG